jgi:putative transposase
MHLSNIGRLAESCWNEIPDHFPFVKLGAFVVMPNHVHGIITIVETLHVETGHVKTLHATSLPPPEPTSHPPHESTKNEIISAISPKTGSLASIIRSYKSAVRRFSKSFHPNFEWQPRFHDQIVRDEEAYRTISEYIIKNPSKWKEDDFFASP